MGGCIPSPAVLVQIQAVLFVPLASVGTLSLVLRMVLLVLAQLHGPRCRVLGIVWLLLH